MNEIRLSDHVQDQINRYEAGRLATEKLRRTEYASANQRKWEAIRTALVHIAHSLFTLRPKKLIEGIQDLRDAQEAPLPFNVERLDRGHKELQHISGREGEDRVRRKLLKLCRKPCTALYGYNGAKGEIDIIVVGRYGVTAIEVKNRSGVIYCDKDSWWRIKSGEIEPIQDATGRSPSVQLNEGSDELQAILSNNGLQIPIRRVVVIANSNATYGNPFSPNVDWACKMEHLTRRVLFDSLPPHTLDRDRIAQVCDVIREAHETQALRSAARTGAKPDSPLYEDIYRNIASKPLRFLPAILVVAACLLQALASGYVMKHPKVIQPSSLATSTASIHGTSAAAGEPLATPAMSGTEHSRRRKMRQHHPLQIAAPTNFKHHTTRIPLTEAITPPVATFLLLVLFGVVPFSAAFVLRAIAQASHTGRGAWTSDNVVDALGWTCKLSLKIAFLPFYVLALSRLPRCWNCRKLGHIARNCPGRRW